METSEAARLYRTWRGIARPDRARIPSDIVDRRGVAAVADLNIPLACGSRSRGIIEERLWRPRPRMTASAVVGSRILWTATTREARGRKAT